MHENLTDFTIRTFVTWLFRERKTERIMFNGAVAVLVAVFGSNAIFWFLVDILKLALPNVLKTFFESVNGLSVWILLLCVAVIVSSIAMAFIRLKSELARENKKKILIVEGRGLRADTGVSLAEAVPKDIKGLRIPLMLDLRSLQDGKAVTPEALLPRIQPLPQMLQQVRSTVAREDLTVFYGGLTSVPFTFLTGVLMDDEGAVISVDWDRTNECWRSLSETDDNEEFLISGLNTIKDCKEVVLAISFSYPVLAPDLNSTFSLPIVRLELPNISSDAHWSAAKQNRLATQFFEVAKELGRLGIDKIHLVFAGPNSVVFNFGRRYDIRNLPNIVVYQFERGSTPAYPWGILMPTGNVDSARVVRTS